MEPGGGILERSPASRHHAEMLYKDLQLAIELANELGIALPAAGFAQQWYQSARASSSLKKDA